MAVGVDARGGKVAVEGWAETSALAATDLVHRFEDCGVSAVIHTDIDRDGMLRGVNIEATEALAAATSIPVIASGGVASLDDLTALAATGRIAGLHEIDRLLAPFALAHVPLHFGQRQFHHLVDVGQ